MGISQDYLDSLKKDITTIIIACIALYGYKGVPLNKVNKEFVISSGYNIPYEKFGFHDLRSFLLSMPQICIGLDEFNNEIVIAQSAKSYHMKRMISKNKVKRKMSFDHNSNGNKHFCKNNNFKNNYYDNTQNGQYSSSSSVNINTYSTETNESFIAKLDNFEKLEAMLPLFYNHQALGDDFFLDVADTKMGYYVPQYGPKKCGLCVVGQTIAQLTKKVVDAKFLAPRVVVMIGFNDLIMQKTASTMIVDLRQLIIELKKRNTMISLLTLIPNPKLPRNNQISMRMDIFNKSILDYANDPQLHCNVIDMNATFHKEMRMFRKDFDRLEKVAKADPYKVFSDYGRKVFLHTLKNDLRKVIESTT